MGEADERRLRFERRIEDGGGLREKGGALGRSGRSRAVGRIACRELGAIDVDAFAIDRDAGLCPFRRGDHGELHVARCVAHDVDA